MDSFWNDCWIDGIAQFIHSAEKTNAIFLALHCVRLSMILVRHSIWKEEYRCLDATKHFELDVLCVANRFVDS